MAEPKKTSPFIEANSQFRLMFDSSSVGMGLLSLDRRIIHANPSISHLSGYSIEELLQIDPSDLVHPDDRTLDGEHFKRMISGEIESYAFEKRYMHKGGGIFWGRLNYSMIRDEAGAPQYIFGTLEDITDHKQAQDELRRSQTWFKAMYDNAAVGIAVMGLDRRLISANRRAEEMSGYSEDEMRGMDLLSMPIPEDRALDTDQFTDLIDGRIETYTMDKRFRRKDGRIFWGRMNYSLARGVDGSPDFVMAIVEDIDERKRARVELEASENRFRMLYDHADVGIVLTAFDKELISQNPLLKRIYGYSDDDIEKLEFVPDERISSEERVDILLQHLVSGQRCNSALLRMLNMTEEEYLKKGILSLIHPEDRGKDTVWARGLITGVRDSFKNEKRFIRKDGSFFWGRLTFSIVRNAAGLPVMGIGIVEDIDEERRAQEKLELSEARFRAMFENSTVGIGIIGPDQRTLEINKATERIIGYSLEEFRKSQLSSITLDEDQSKDDLLFKELLERKRDQYQVDKRYIHKDGRVFWGRVTYSAVRDAEGEVQYLIALIEDIDEQKMAQEKLARQEAEYRLSLEQRVLERTLELQIINDQLQQEIVQRMKAEQALADKAAQEAIAAERTRLARDLHDAVTQTLFSASLIADVLPDIWEMNQSEGERRLAELRGLTRGALAEMRTLLVELRPNALIEVPLPTLLRQLAEATSARARLEIDLSIDGDRKLPPDVQVALYRISQEAVNNIHKHAKATQAVIALRLGQQVQLSITDNGQGFDPTDVTLDHLGLRIMSERADGIAAKLKIYSEPGEGTQITVIWSDKE